MRKKSGYIQNRGSSWRIAYYADGRRHFETFKTRDDAERELAGRLADAARGIPVSSAANTVRFGELCTDVRNEYLVNKRKSLASLDSRMENHIVPAFGLRKAASITTSQLNAYILQRQGATPTPSTGTINRELEAIRHVFNFAKQGGKVLHMPHVPHLRENNVRTGFFTGDEIERLCAHLTPVLALFVRFAFLTGWRRGEISGLRWSNVDWVANEIRLEPGTTKSGEGRVFPMTRELRELFAELACTQINADKAKQAKLVKLVPRKIAAAIAPFVFEINRLPVGEFRAQWLAANHKAGLPRIVNTKGEPVKALRIFHDIRRSAARRFLQAGLSQSHIMSLCGWRTSAMFERYAIVTTADLREALERMGHDAPSKANTP